MRSMSKMLRGWLLAFGIAGALISPAAEARRGGSFGSRGSHTYASPNSTRLSPGYVGPVSRSMTQQPGYGSSRYQPSYGSNYGPTRPRFGFGGGLLTGLVTGGLVGAMLGHHGSGYGYGSSDAGGGMLAVLIQLAVIGGGIWLLLGFLRRRRDTGQAPSMPLSSAAGFQGTGFGYAVSGAPGGMQTTMDERIDLSAGDKASFERLLGELQDAFGREDYARLRAITTPEIMSFLAEELSDNAVHGRRNEVSGTRLLDAEVSEAWREQGADYATIAMRYEGVDVMRDRNTNSVLSGDPGHPSQTTELWTFVRSGAWSDWKVSAIQEV